MEPQEPHIQEKEVSKERQFSDSLETQEEEILIVRNVDN
jgi:hypothetical protein